MPSRFSSNAWGRFRTGAVVVLMGTAALATPGSGCSSATDRSGPRGALAGRGGVGGDGGAAGDASGDAASGGVAGASLPPKPPRLENPCNGSDAYCALPYDQTCFAATRDSAASSAQFWQRPTQDRTLREQFNGGIRALMLSVYDDGGVATVCRGDCDEGNTPLGVVLADVATFFDENPREVLTLLIDGELPANRLAQELSARGLDALALPHTGSEAWPTLGEMIEAGTRLVVLASAPDGGPAWLLPRRELLWETGADFSTVSAMNCNPKVGDTSRPLYLVHHNLLATDAGEPAVGGEGGEGGASAGAGNVAAAANQFGVVTERLTRCEAQHGRPPSFVAVDFAHLGDAVGATQVINGVREP